MKDLTTENIKSLLNEKGMRQKELEGILNLTPANISKMMNGNRKISESEQKLLKLYFYGIMPFDLLAPREGYSSELKFTADEWRVLEVMARRNGHHDTTKWIVSHIREYLAFCDAQHQHQLKQAQPVDHTLDHDTEPHYLPFYGCVAAGEPITSQLVGETLPVSTEYPAGHFIIEVNGQSMEPTLEDGTRWICEPKEYTPKHNELCIISDSQGSSVKRYNRELKRYESDNPNYPAHTPLSEVKLRGYIKAKYDR